MNKNLEDTLRKMQSLAMTPDDVYKLLLENERLKAEKAPSKEEILLSLIKRVGDKHNWKHGWSARGCYLHLESSELIEALRGKGGNPTDEAGDVLGVLMSIIITENLDWNKVLDMAIIKMDEMLK